VPVSESVTHLGQTILNSLDEVAEILDAAIAAAKGDR